MAASNTSTGDARLQAGKLSSVVSLQDSHGWCGLANLRHSDYPSDWQLSPALTLEHYIGVPIDAPEYVEYEPCASEHSLSVQNAAKCTLEYRPMKCSELGVRITYEVRAPHYVDVNVEATTERVLWPYGSLALFFATIVKAPLYTGVTFLGDDERLDGKRAGPWIHFNGMGAVPGRTAYPRGVDKPELERPANAPDTYYYSDSSVRFDEPFYYGVVGRMAYCLMFRREHREDVRFTVNPLAPAFGGPAWDFFWVIRRPVAGKHYILPLRVVYMPNGTAEDVRGEYAKFAGEGH